MPANVDTVALDHGSEVSDQPTACLGVSQVEDSVLAVSKQPIRMVALVGTPRAKRTVPSLINRWIAACALSGTKPTSIAWRRAIGPSTQACPHRRRLANSARLDRPQGIQPKAAVWVVQPWRDKSKASSATFTPPTFLRPNQARAGGKTQKAAFLRIG